MDRLRKLQRLSWMRLDSWTTDMLKLVNLQKLGIIELKSGKVGEVVDSIVDRFPKLTSLSLEMYGGDSFSKIERLSGMHQLLKLDLWGDMRSFLKLWPPNIVKLKLSYTNSSEDPMPVLEKLEHLVDLRLHAAYEGRKILCSGEGFPRLQNLEIVNFDTLEEWEVEKGAMPCLRTCKLVYCPQLKMMPKGFKSVAALETLEIYRLPKEFAARVKGGDDWKSVKHIPSITSDWY